MSTHANLASTIDALGALKAQISDLERAQKAIYDGLKTLPPGAYEGERFRLVISETVRETLEIAKVRTWLSEEVIKECTRETSVRVHKVSARSGREVIND